MNIKDIQQIRNIDTPEPPPTPPPEEERRRKKNKVKPHLEVPTKESLVDGMN
jgi:hypothetical protein